MGCYYARVCAGADVVLTLARSVIEKLNENARETKLNENARKTSAPRPLNAAFAVFHIYEPKFRPRSMHGVLADMHG